jgi:hypothetical protein
LPGCDGWCEARTQGAVVIAPSSAARQLSACFANALLIARVFCLGGVRPAAPATAVVVTAAAGRKDEDEREDEGCQRTSHVSGYADHRLAVSVSRTQDPIERGVQSFGPPLRGPARTTSKGRLRAGPARFPNEAGHPSDRFVTERLNEKTRGNRGSRPNKLGPLTSVGSKHEGGKVITRTKRMGASLLAASLLATGVLAPTAAAARQTQDGLVNVAIGDITIQDIQVAVAAQVVATACDLVDASAAVGIIAAVDSGDVKSTTFCRTDAGQVKVTQNTDD